MGITKQKTNDLDKKVGRKKQTGLFSPKELRVTIACTLPVSVASKVDTLAQTSGTTKSQVMQELVMTALSLKELSLMQG